MAVAVAVLVGFVVAIAAPWLYRILGHACGWVLALLPAGLAFWFAVQVADLPAQGWTTAVPWIPSLGIQLSFHLDGLSLLMALLITAIGALILIYAGGYLAGHPQLGRLYAFLLMFMSSMLGVVLADNALTLFVFWELTSISSYLLIGFNHDDEKARAAALQALLVTGGGGLALMAGLLLLGHVGGSYELSVLATRGDVVRGSGLYLPMLLLILLGAFTKSAQFPFHFWLPNAMAAPTPVSAYLHSATMVKAGIYLLARLTPILGGTIEWQAIVASVGAATMLVGAVLAVQMTDLKRILGYSTISALGVLTLLLGVGGEAAITAAVVFLLAHALYKGTLFLSAGAVEHETGTRNVDELGGLWRAMPIIAFAAGAAGLAMAGLPPLFGFIAKEALNEAVLPAPLLALATVVASMFLTAAACLVGLAPFWGQQRETPKHPHEAPLSLWLGPALLSALGLLFGVAPGLIDEPLLARSVAAVLCSEPHALHLALWHGWTAALAMSAVALSGGAVCYAFRGRIRAFAPWGDWGPARGYELALHGLNKVAAYQTHLLQSGYLRRYLMIVLASFTLLVGVTAVTFVTGIGAAHWGKLHVTEICLVLLTIAATIAAVRRQPRLAAIATLGVIGYSIALLFVLFGAPDLAMTQFLVETLTVILFVLVFHQLPESPPLSSAAARGRDAALALAVGGVMTLLVLLATQTQLAPSIASYYAANSYPEAHGRNVVNVILVDFRGFDTLGEITVLSVAAVGVYALLKLRPAPVVAESAASEEAAP